jgi:pimeloyl-ACP methyl ester carboxylesterase
MTTTNATTRASTSFSGYVRAGDVDLWVEQRGAGPDVLLIAGLSDPAESWQLQLDGLADRYRVTAFDTRDAGRSSALPDGFTVADMADDAASILKALEIASAHVCGFSGGSATAQELVLRHPDLVTSLVLVGTWARPDAFFRTMVDAWAWLPDAAPSERAALETFFLWIYGPSPQDQRGHASAVDPPGSSSTSRSASDRDANSTRKSSRGRSSHGGLPRRGRTGL